MYALLLRLRRRIRKMLKVQTESRQISTPSSQANTAKIFFLLLVSISIGIIYPGEVLYDPLDTPREGEIAPKDYKAPFQIILNKTEREIEREREQVRQATLRVVDVDTSKVVATIEDMQAYARFIDSLMAVDSLELRENRREFVDSISQRYPNLGQIAIDRSLDPRVKLDTVVALLADVFTDRLYRTGIVGRADQLPISPNPLLTVRRGDQESNIDQTRIPTLDQAYGQLISQLKRIASTDSIDVEFYYKLGINFMVANVKQNNVEYQRRVQAALGQLSEIKEVVNEGDVIVSARSIVSAEQEEILQQMVRIQQMQDADKGWLVPYLPAIARVALVLAAFVAFYLFLFYFRPLVYRSNAKLLTLFLVFALQMALIPATVSIFDLKTIYIYPIAVLPVMVTILFDAEIGILSTMVLALLIGIMHRFSFSATLMTVVIGFIACFSSRRVRKRSDFYRIMLAVIASSVILIFTVESLKLTPSVDLWEDLLYGILSNAISIMIVMVFLPVFESLFGITTDTRLLELSDLNHPLLRRLSIEAPGTYHHSISVGNLSESAAEAIHANSLLARVGTYYHDIGKIEIPEYFVENQFSVKSKHDQLTPAMSALILTSHVKKGRLLGEEADIPDDVLNFIEEHHGTMVMTYFYNKALEQGEDPGMVDKYRYPGPKPQTRETGIAMLADAVEAASRTLDEPKPARIDSLIQRIINDRFQSGELDECPLTLRDLAGIKRAFAQVLMAAFHHRVKYPTRDEEKS